MRKVINNRKYDTYSSWSIGEEVRGKMGTDRFTRDELFIKTTGEYFMLCESSKGPSPRIIPLDERTALLWMRDHCGAYANKYISPASV